MENLSKIVENLQDDLIQSVQQLIKINSVEDKPQEGMPFGKGVDQALRYTIELGKKLGFRTTYKNGYYGYIEMGEGDELIGILAHLDVVPVDDPENWTYPPFGGEIHDNRIYGRGAVDDKGPLLAALYAMKAVDQAGIKLSKRIRLILGTNEETRWEGIHTYLKQEEIPICGFSPDSDYPLINAEKGLLQLKLFTDQPVDFTLQGGGALNSVPERCTYENKDIHFIEEGAKSKNYKYSIDAKSITLYGKAVHSAKAFEGVNAIARMALLLHNSGVDSPMIQFIAKEIGEDVQGKNVFGNFEDSVSGKITFNMAKIQMDQKCQCLYIDIRYPVTKSKEEVLALLEGKAKDYGLTLKVLDSLPALYVPEDHPLVMILRKIYEEETGLDSTPIATGGATYARALKNCVAFGPLFPGQPKMAHQTNEYIDIDSLIKSTLIYSKAIARLGVVQNKIAF